jgi:hypothetical protein
LLKKRIKLTPKKADFAKIAFILFYIKLYDLSNHGISSFAEASISMRIAVVSYLP